jgi:hypothetical protein
MSDYRRGFGLGIGFIDHLQLVNTSNYSTIAYFHTLQITTAHAKFFQPAVTSCFLVTDPNNADSSATLLSCTN